MSPITLAKKLPLPLALIAVTAIPAFAASEPLALEEIVVTAQKKSEALSDIPMTVNVISGDELSDFASFRFEDLTNVTAGVTISGSEYNSDIAIRGLGTDLHSKTNPRVTLYLDGAFAIGQNGLFTGLYDLERFEVLRGPQGTLYGKTSPAGAILIQTRSPSMDSVDGYFKQTFAEYDSSNSQFGLSLPIIEDKLSVRVSGLYDENSVSDVENTTLDHDNNNRTKAFRIVTAWQPSESFDLRLAYQDIDDDYDQDQVVYGAGLDFDDRIAVGDVRSFMSNSDERLTLSMNWSLPNDWLLTSASSRVDNTVDRTLDMDATQVHYQHQRILAELDNFWNSELRLSSQGNETWDWIVGAYLENGSPGSAVNVETNTAVAPGLVIQALTDGPTDYKLNTAAIFGHSAFHISENDTVTVGLRYAEEEQTVKQSFHIDLFTITDGQSTPGASYDIESIAPEDEDSDDSTVTGTLKYQHHFTDDLMGYATYDRGWRAGSVNVFGTPTPPGFSLYDPETSDSIELGSKWTFLQGRGQLNVAAYYQLFDDFHYQAENILFRDGLAPFSPVVNVNEAEVYGLDGDVSLLLTENWTLNAALSYNKTELTDAKGVPCNNDEPLPTGALGYNTCDLTGERAGGGPEWSTNVSTEYWRVLGNSNIEWYVRGLLNAESEYYSQSLDQDLDSYFRLDVQAGVRSASLNWDVTLWVKNLTDESALLKASSLQPVADFDNGGTIDLGYSLAKHQLNPRMAGVSLHYNF
jgi:iron complex outermembrane receptor protein